MAFGGETAESYYDEGLTALVRGDLDHAMRFLTRAIELDRGFFAAYHQLGRCYTRMGKLRRAIELLDRVVTAKPDLVPARLDLGQALLSLGEIDRARRHFAVILDVQPTNGRAYLGMAQAAFQEGNWEGAVNLAQGARAHGGANFAVLYLLGRAAKLAGNHILAEESLFEADRLLEKNIEMNPDSPEGHFLRGEVCFVQERFASALESFRAAQDRADVQRVYSTFGENFTRADIMLKQGLCLQRLGNNDGAREFGKQVLAIDPENRLAQALSQL